MTEKIKKETEELKDDTVSYSGEEENVTKSSKEAGKPSKEEEVTPDPEQGPQIDVPQSKRNWTRILLILSLIGNMILVGLLFTSQAAKIGMFEGATPSPTPIEISSSPTPTPDEIDLEAYEIEVQNGSGIAGEGAKIKETLEKAGFKVGDVGNADNSNYIETIITVSEKVDKAYVDELTKVLEKRGAVGKIEKFAEGEDGEVSVIIGSDVEEDPSPTPEP